jgi:biopolymer transport protein ExbB/TolQ
MLLISLVGIVGLFVLLERFYGIVLRAKTNGRPFIERVLELVRADRVDDAIQLCAASAAALPDVGLVILRARTRDERELRDVAAAAVFAVVPRLHRRLHYLPALAASAVMLGVASTVVRLHDTLMAAAGHDAATVLAATAAGAADALMPTAFGLAVAVVLTLGRAFLADQAESTAQDVREFSARLINALTNRPDVRLGHR